MAKNPYIAIAISRLLGAGGALLGQRLARRLGYAYLNRAILQQAAEKLGINDAELACWEEHCSRFWDRLAETLAVGPPEARYCAAPGGTAVRDHQLFQLESHVIREAAFSRNVIVIGRAGFWVLRDHPGLVSVFLHAPRAARIPQVMQTFNLATAAQAGEMIDRVDADRSRFVREMTGQIPGDARCYHLSMDTSRIDLDAAEEMVMRLPAIRGRL